MADDRIPLHKMGYQCKRCGHPWVPVKNQRPRICPKCKTAYWDVPRKEPAN